MNFFSRISAFSIIVTIVKGREYDSLTSSSTSRLAVVAHII